MPVFNVTPTNPEKERVSKNSVERKLSYIHSYFQKLEAVFEKESASLLQEIRLEDKRTKDHEDDSQYDYRPSDSLMEIEFIYLRMHRYSAVLAIYSYLEGSMYKLCHELEVSKKVQASVQELNGKNILEYKKYLVKHANFDLTEINCQWSRSVFLGDVRHCIMHANGNIESVKKPIELRRKIEQYDPLLSLIDGSMIMVSKDFIDKSIEDTRVVLTYLIEQSR